MEMLLLSLIVLLPVGNMATVSLRQSPAFLSEITDTVFRMADENEDGTLSTREVQIFLGTPGQQSSVKMAFREDLRQEADSNRNGQLERYEVPGILSSLVRSTKLPATVLIYMVLEETNTWIAKGQIKLPQTNSGKAELTLSTLDRDSNEKLSEEEIRVFYSLVGTNSFLTRILELADMVDVNGDQQLDMSETEFSALTIPVLVTYGRIMNMLGYFPISM